MSVNTGRKVGVWRLLWGAIACSDTPRPMPHEPATVALAGAMRGAALLWAFPAQRDEDLRGALGVGGDGLACVQANASSAHVLACSASLPFVVLCSANAMLLCSGLFRRDEDLRGALGVGGEWNSGH